MKKINFKVILVVVLALVLVLSFAACNKDNTPTPPGPTPPIGPDIALYLGELIDGIDLTVNSLSDLTDRFEANIEFFAEVNDVLYSVSIKANVDLRETATNDDNNLAVEVKKGTELVLGFYYNGSEDAIFLNIPHYDIARYIDGFDFLAFIHDVTDPVEGGFASLIPNISLGELVGDFLDIATIAFSDVKVTNLAGGITRYEFELNAGLIAGFLPMLLTALDSYAADINAAIDKIFGIEGFSITDLEIPDFELTLIAEIGDLGLTKLAIDLFVPAFDFYINPDADPIAVNAFALVAGINLLIKPASTAFTVDTGVPSIEDGDYEYFSPLNIDTQGTFTLAGEGSLRFVAKTDVNPFKLTESEVFVKVEIKGVEDLEYKTVLEINTIGGEVYIMILDGGVEKLYTYNIQEAIDLVVDVVKALMAGEVVIPEQPEGEGSGFNPDFNKIIGVVTKVPDLIVDGVLTINKAFIAQVIDALGIEDAELPADLKITAWETDKGARAEVYIKNIYEAEDEEEEDEVVENTFYGEFTKVGKVYTIEVGFIVDGEDYKFADAVLTLKDDGFTLLVTMYDYDEEGEIDYEKVIIDLALTEFQFTWGARRPVGATAPDAEEIENYKNILAGIDKDVVIDYIQEMLYKIMGVEPPAVGGDEDEVDPV